MAQASGTPSRKKREDDAEALKKKKEEEEEAARLAQLADERRQQVSRTLQEAGATSTYAFTDPEAHGVTMKALLLQYTQHATLTETDENGEHPLIPTGRGRDHGESRNLRNRAHHGGDASDSAVALRAGEDDRNKNTGGKQGTIDNLLQRIENDRLPQLKDDFNRRGNMVNCEEFVEIMLPYVDGGDEKQTQQQLQELHDQLVQNSFAEADANEAYGSEGTGQKETQAAFLTETEEGAEGFVTWGMLAKVLLERGVVGDAVKRFDVVKVLSYVELDRIAPLRDEFMQKGNALPVEQFIVTMKKQFQHIFDLVSLFDLHQEERRLYAELYNLFEMIDISGTGALSWEEFTAFLVDQGMTEDVAREFNVIRFSSSSARDDLYHQSHVEKAFYFKHYDKVAFFEQGSRSLRLMNSDLTMYREIRDFTQVPLCAEYIDKYDFLVVSCSDLTLSFYDAERLTASGPPPLVRRIETKTAQLVMCWSEVGQVLFSADHEGRIFAWDMQLVKAGVVTQGWQGNDQWKAFEKKSVAQQDPPMRHIDMEGAVADQAHRMRLRADIDSRDRGKGGGTDLRHSNSGSTIVMMLLELPVLACLASCGVDRNVMIWDVFTGMWRKTLRGHAMGVRCMAFATSTKVLVTGGFDYNLFVWNPYVGNSVHNIRGHSAPIVGIEVLGSASNQVVSADSEGFMRTWDLGTYQCLQTILVDEILTLRAFVSIPSHKRVLAADRRFVAYDYQNTGVADQTDEAPIIKAFYNERLKIFISGCSTHLRIWDAVTGAIKCVITHREAEITDFCVDDRGRKVFIADHEGDIFVHNSSTGCFIKKLTKHASEVSGLIYCKGDRNILSVSWDRSIVVHDESEKAEKIWRKASNIHDGDVTCVAFSRHLGLIATGSTDYVISLRQYERLRTISSLMGHKSDISAVAFVEPFPLLVSADISGFVAIWAVPAPSGKQHEFVNEVLTRFINMQSLESSASVNCLDPVCEMVSDVEGRSFHLFAGDEDGDVRAWDLSQLLVAARVSECRPKVDWDPRKREKIDLLPTSMAASRQAKAVETPELPIKIQEQVVRRILSWRAHGDSVRSIKVQNSPPCVVTAGYDHMVKVWTREGELMTVLRAYGQTPWNFPVQGGMAGVDEEGFEDVLQKVIKAERQSVNVRPRNTMPVFSLHGEVQKQKTRMLEQQEHGSRSAR